MSAEYKKELKFGGKVLASNICQQTSNEQMLPNINSVYIDAPAINNVDKTQLYIDPVTHKINLGRTRIQEIKPDWTGKITEYNVYLNTSLVPTEQDQEGGETPEIQNKILSVTEGEGISIDFEQDFLRPTISIDKDVVVTKDNLSEIEDSLEDVEKSVNDLKLINNNSILDIHQYYDLIELLKVVDVVYSDSPSVQQNTMQWVESNTSNMNIIAFSYKYVRQENLKGLNCLRIKTNSTQQNECYCVIHKCKPYVQSDGPDYNAPETFFEYLDETEVLTISKYPAKLNKEGKYYEWNFSKTWDMIHSDDQSSIYLVTFHSKKDEKWKWENRVAINAVISGQSSIKSNLQFCWDNDFNSNDVLPEASFSLREPVGTLIKTQEN